MCRPGEILVAFESYFKVNSIHSSKMCGTHPSRTSLTLDFLPGGCKRDEEFRGPLVRGAICSVLLYIHKQGVDTISYLLPTSDIRAACFISKYHLSFYSFSICISTRPFAFYCALYIITRLRRKRFLKFEANIPLHFHKTRNIKRLFRCRKCLHILLNVTTHPTPSNVK